MALRCHDAQAPRREGKILVLRRLPRGSLFQLPPIAVVLSSKIGLIGAGIDRAIGIARIDMRDVNQLAHLLIGLGIEIHRVLGPGLPEGVYERAFCIEGLLLNFNEAVLKDGIRRVVLQEPGERTM